MKQATKNILLVTGFFLLLAVAYQYSFLRTFEVKNQLEELETQIGQNSGSHQDIIALEKKEVYLDSLIYRNRNGTTSLQNNLLKVLNEQSSGNNLKIVNFKEPHVQKVEGEQSKTTSFQFVLEGNYKSLEGLLLILERDYSFGSLSHVSFNRIKNYRLNKDFLQCSVVVQNVE